MPEFKNAAEPDMANKVLGLLASRLNRAEQNSYLKCLKEVEAPSSLWHGLRDRDLGAALKCQMSSEAAVREAEKNILNWKRAGIEAVAFGSEDYPFLLTQIAAPPLILFYRGSGVERLNNAFCLSVVGARNADPEGREIAANLSRQVSEAGGCVVSGLAYGIDSVAHQAALEGGSGAGLPTVAVLGNGLDTIYPSAHRQLAADILENSGLILSQFEPGERPYPSNFLNRNRLIAGLSKGVIVVQAAQRSGSLSTARYALEEGREVCAVPGSIFSSRHQGTNSLIKQGAYIVTCPEDLLEIFPELNQHQKKPAECEIQFTEEQARLLSAFKVDEMHYDELAALSGGGQAFPKILLELEFLGYVKRLPGNYVARRLPGFGRYSG